MTFLSILSDFDAVYISSVWGSAALFHCFANSRVRRIVIKLVTREKKMKKKMLVLTCLLGFSLHTETMQYQVLLLAINVIKSPKHMVVP